MRPLSAFKIARAPFRLVSPLMLGLALSAGLTAPSAQAEPSTDAAPAAQLAPPRPENCRAVFIRLEGPTAAKPGEVIRYRIRVKNEGDCQVKDAVVTDFIPRESRYISAYPEPSSEPQSRAEPRMPVGKVEWRGVPITSSEIGEYFEVKVAVTGSAGRVITNTACVEHAKLGRLCDTYDTYVKASLIEDPIDE